MSCCSNRVGESAGMESVFDSRLDLPECLGMGCEDPRMIVIGLGGGRRGANRPISRGKPCATANPLTENYRPLKNDHSENLKKNAVKKRP